ncbi:MAG: hypothetical protein WEA59_02575 [Ferruginibacter sp.]
MKSYHSQPSFINIINSQKKVLPASFYVKNLGFFCKQELKFEAATGIPFKFRLGSVTYCDWMEGKSNMNSLPPMQY